jgi:hypothetical protein
MEENKNLKQNLDKSNEKLHISDVMTSILNELEELKSMYKHWDDDKDSFTSINGVYRHKASGIEDSIKIVKKYWS